MKKQISYFLLGVFTLCMACQTQPVDRAQQIADSLRNDSLTLKIGYLPTIDCLPLLVAQEDGLLDSLNVKIRLVRYEAGMDLDTAFQRNRINGMLTDLCRAIQYNQKDEEIKVISKTDGIYYLVTARKQRLRKVKDLKERMVAIARNEVSDFLLDKLLTSEKMGTDEVNRPQINAIPLRQDMITNEEIDAGIIPEPYATRALVSGDRLITDSKKLNSQLGCIVFPLKTIVDREKDLIHLTVAYNLAAERINQSGKKYASLLQKEFGVNVEVTDTLILPHFDAVNRPLQKDVDEAAEWLKQRKLITDKYKTNRIIDIRFILN